MNSVYWKGKLVPPGKVFISPLNTGFFFGESLFESLPVYRGTPLFFKEHLGRLKRGCRFLGWPFLPDREFKKAIRLFSDRKDLSRDFLIRFNLVQEIEGSTNPREFFIKKPVLFAVARALRHSIDALFPTSGKVGISPWWAADAKTLPNQFKIPYYLTTRRVFRENPGWNEMLKLNRKGEVVDGGASTPLWFDGEKVHVPPLNLGGLESVTRNKVIQLLRRLQVRVVEREWKPSDVFKKRKTRLKLSSNVVRTKHPSENGELILVGSGVGIMSASHLMNRKIKGNPLLAEQLWEVYRQIAARENGD